MIRRFLCRWFFLHDPKLVYENPTSPWDFYRCSHCGLDVEKHWHTQEIRFLDFAKKGAE